MIRRLPLAAASLLVGSCARSAPPAPESWEFPAPLPPAASRALDLRSLNEAKAGQSGFVRLSADGEDFVLGDGKPARFWPILSDGWRELSPDDMDRQARFLAAMGFNMVRIHANLPDTGKDATLDGVDRKAIDRIKRYAKSCRDNGIYLVISPMWLNNAVPDGWGLEGYTFAGGKFPYGPIFFNPKLQAAYRGWAKALYDTPNPYTGVRLADDPTVAVIQVQNEDSLLFWTFDAMPDAQKAILAKRYGAWLASRYGSLEKARAAWGDATVDRDDWAGGAPSFYITWELTRPQTGAKAIRVRDQTRFIAEAQRRFYAEIARFYRQDLGCKQLINATNWKSADKLRLDDLERWTYTAGDVIAVNRYADAPHDGKNTGWRLDPGDHFQPFTALKDPLKLPANLKQVVGHPMLLTESLWVPPTPYRSESMFLQAVYQSLNGVDGTFWLGTSTVDYKTPVFPYQQVEGQNPILKFHAERPDVLGMSPANALLFRMGYVQRGATVVREARPMQDLWERKPPRIAESEQFDPNRDRVGQSRAMGATEVSPLAFLVGPVKVEFDAPSDRTTVADLSPYVDFDKRIVRSITGEVALDWGKGLCTVNAPKAQGVAGFLKTAGGRFSLKDMTLESDNDYAAVTVVPLDDLPLARSRKVLVQFGTTSELTGWSVVSEKHAFGGAKEPSDALRIVNVGKPPYRVVATRGTLTIANKALNSATRIAPNGSAAGTIPVRREGDGLIVTLPPDAMYVILSAD